MHDDLADDPGWRLSWKTFLLVLIPGGGLGLAKKRSPDSLQMMRNVFVSFCTASLLIGGVVVLLGDLDPKTPDRPGLAVPIVVGVGVLCLALKRFVSRPLDCTTAATLAATYRSRFFLRVAFSEACALSAFAVYIAIGPGWVYLIGLAFTLVGYAGLAPTRAHLRGDQDALSMNGCTLSLIEALRAAWVTTAAHQIVPEAGRPTDT